MHFHLCWSTKFGVHWWWEQRRSESINIEATMKARIKWNFAGNWWSKVEYFEWKSKHRIPVKSAFLSRWFEGKLTFQENLRWTWNGVSVEFEGSIRNAVNVDRGELSILLSSHSDDWDKATMIEKVRSTADLSNWYRLCSNVRNIIRMWQIERGFDVCIEMNIFTENHKSVNFGNQKWMNFSQLALQRQNHVISSPKPWNLWIE
jgi:hypothetical protein